MILDPGDIQANLARSRGGAYPRVWPARGRALVSGTRSQ